MLQPRRNPRFGVLHALAAWRNPDAYFRYRARDSDHFAMALPGMGKVLFAGRPGGVREFLKVPAAEVAPPRPNPIEPVVGEGSLILISGEAHRRERARLLSALRSERVRTYAQTMAQAAQEEMAAWRPGSTVDVRDATQNITLRVIVRAIFGVEEKHRCDDYIRLIKAMMRSYVAPLMFIPALRRAPAGLGPWRRFSRLRRALDTMLSEEIQSRRGDGAGGHDDVLSALLVDHDCGQRDDDVVRQQLRTLLVAGHETTATTLAWAMYHVHHDDAVRRRLLDELADCPSPDVMWRLPYLSAVVSETLRLHPTVSIVVRQLKCPVARRKTARQRGDVLGVALPALHADPAVWQDPLRFDPERFLAGRPSPVEYSPYGYGHRRCVGSAFANVELSVVLGTILSCAELKMTSRQRRRKPPHSVPRGIAALPNRRITLQMIGRR
ncbi:MAG: cytochrome [Mycobacterium sp.]|jgi:cytochrome P450|nr:cytochrome [Mycobacterium sp.]